jgi:hypothetical protein
LLSLNVAVGKVDADVEKALAKKYSIESFPTILHFPMRDRPTVSATISTTMPLLSMEECGLPFVLMAVVVAYLHASVAPA